MDKYGYIGIETLLDFCENSKDHSVTPNDFMRMKRVRMPERKKGKWMTSYLDHEVMGVRPKLLYCSKCCQCIAYPTNYCPNCGAKMEEGDQDG